MKKSTAIGVAIAAISVTVGVVGCGKESKPSSPSSSASTSTSTSASASTTASPTSTSAQASGPNETIADYIKQNNIQETNISHSTAGAPTIDLPVPDGWTKIPESPDAPYGGIVFTTPTDPNDPPKITAVFDKLTGNVDTDKLLSYAPGEVKNLPGYDGGDGEKNSLSGFPAYQLGGNYMKNGTQRVIAQKTVVIQASDGIYVLQINAQGPEPDKTPLMDATNVIDDKTTITVS
jgi:probable lipoprotein LpqN